MEKNPKETNLLIRFIESSAFVQKSIRKHPEWKDFLENMFLQSISQKETLVEPNDLLLTTQNSGELFIKTREWKTLTLIKIAFADFLGFRSVEQSIADFARLADACIDLGMRYGVLKTKLIYNKVHENVFILGMGKLGGKELNLSSDIDLIFFCRDGLDFSFRIQLEHVLVNMMRFLREGSAEGFLYRVDMRLRPEGEVGSLLVSLEQALEYYKVRARQWEYQAMVKNRCVWGDAELYKLFRHDIDSLVYTHHEPERILREIKGIKDRIEEKIRSRGETGNVKLSPGGIRDIEFIIQFLQLVHGARYTSIRVSGSLPALRVMKALGIVQPDEFEVLESYYLFLRRVENILQLKDNLSVQNLPREDADLEDLFAPWSLIEENYANYSFGRIFRQIFIYKMSMVRQIFVKLFDHTLEYLNLRSEIELNCSNIAHELIEQHFLRMDSEYFLEFKGNDICRHLEMIALLDSKTLVQTAVEKVGENEWILIIVSFDYFYEFSKIAGMVSSYRLKILSGTSFTYCNYQDIKFRDQKKFYRRPGKQIASGSFPQYDSLSTLRKRKIVCRLRVQSVGKSPDWKLFEEELQNILEWMDQNEQQKVENFLNNRILRLIGQIETPDHLQPVELNVDNASSDLYTILELKSGDSFAFLYIFTNVLAMRNVYINRIEIETEEGLAVDRLFVMKADGSKFTKNSEIEELGIVVTLIKQYSLMLVKAVNPTHALKYFNELLERILQSRETEELPIIGQSDVQKKLAALFGMSDYLWRDLFRLHYPTLLPLLSDVQLNLKRTQADLKTLFLEQYRPKDLSIDAFAEEINRFKSDEMFRIDLRQILVKIDFFEFANELTDLAEVVLDLSFKRIEQERKQKFSNRTTCRTVFALGKMGGRELGYASDIEILFVYQHSKDDRETDLVFYEGMVRSLLKLIHSKREGIFEIDLNLRPHGKAGPLAVSEDAFGEYFSDSGSARLFERQALIKMRAVSCSPGSEDLVERVLQKRDAFVYSDIPADLQEFFKLRQKQMDAYLKNPKELNVKYFPGGLVDIEYTVQLLQIQYGKNYMVRQASTLDAIDALESQKLLSIEVAEDLREAYAFYRNLINSLRMVRGNAKDLVVYSEDSAEYRYLVRRLHFSGVLKDTDSNGFRQRLEQTAQKVLKIREELFST